MKYQQRVNELRRLKKEGLSNIYRRTTHLAALLSDQQYRTKLENNGIPLDDFEVADVLQAYVSDCALTVLELVAVLSAFPEEEQWEERSLRDLYVEAVERATPPKTYTPRTRASVTTKQYNELLDQNKQLEYAVKTSEERLNSRDKVIEDLREENQRLRDENKILEGRIAELERLFDRQAAHAS